MTDREKIVTLSKLLRCHLRSTPTFEYIDGLRYQFNGAGEVVSVARAKTEYVKIGSDEHT